MAISKKLPVPKKLSFTYSFTDKELKAMGFKDVFDIFDKFFKKKAVNKK